MAVGVVGEGSMGFPHMVIGKDWIKTCVLIECVGEYGPWTQSTHQQRAMIWVCLDQMVKGEEHHVIWYKGTLIERRLSQIVEPY
jgi:hypothetical protein